MGWLSDLKEQHAKLGARRFWWTMAGAITGISIYAGLRTWLSWKVRWPEDYDFYCGGRGCGFAEIFYSIRLLHNGSADEIGLFLLIWLMPACMICMLIAYAIYRLSGKGKKLD